MTSQASIIADLDARIDEGLRNITILRQARNESAFTYNLPPELLAKIMIMHRDIVIHEAYLWEQNCPIGFLIPWIVPSQVSSHWRSIAVHCATLWNTIWLGHPWWTKISIERSKDALLFVIMDPCFLRIPEEEYLPQGSSAVDCLLMVLEPQVRRRLKCLGFHLSAFHALPTLVYNTPPAFQRLLNGTFPQLEQLEIISGSYDMDMRRETDDWASNFLRRILTDKANYPPLKQLVINGFPSFTWISTDVSTLTHLHVTELMDITLPSILDLLSRLPALEDLYLDHCLDWSKVINDLSKGSSSTETVKEVTLLHLRRLTINAIPTEFLNAFLENVILPQDVQFALQYGESELLGGPKRLRLFNAIHSYLPPSECHCLLFSVTSSSLTIAFSRHTNIQLTADVHPAAMGNPKVLNATHKIMFKFEAHTVDDDDEVGVGDDTPTAILDLLRDVFHHVERLIFVYTYSKRFGRYRWNSSTWIEAFARLPRLECMEVWLGLGAQDGLLAALAPKGMRSSIGIDKDLLGELAVEGKVVPFPVLRSLNIRYGVFPLKNSLDDPSYDFVSLGIFWSIETAPSTEEVDSGLFYTWPSRDPIFIPPSFIHTRTPPWSPRSYSDAGSDTRILPGMDSSQPHLVHSGSPEVSPTRSDELGMSAQPPAPIIPFSHSSSNDADEDWSRRRGRLSTSIRYQPRREWTRDSDRSSSLDSSNYQLKQSSQTQLEPKRSRSLLSILKARREAGTPLHQLSFKDCGGLNSSMLDSLRREKVAQDVIWDEVDVLDDENRKCELRNVWTVWRYLGEGEKEEE